MLITEINVKEEPKRVKTIGSFFWSIVVTAAHHATMLSAVY